MENGDFAYKHPELVEAITRTLRDEHGARPHGRQWRLKCLFHEEDTPSLDWDPTKGVYHCFGCNAKGGALALAKHLGLELPTGARSERREEAAMFRAFTRPTEPAIEQDNAPAAPLPTKDGRIRLHADLWEADSPEAVTARAWLQSLKIGPSCGWGLHVLRPSDLATYQLPRAAVGTRLIIPVRDSTGQVRDLRRYAPSCLGAAKPAEKMLPWAKGYGQARPYGWYRVILGAPVVWCEGELDCEVLHAHGFTAVTNTCGANVASKVVAELLDEEARRSWTLLFDHDDAGRSAAKALAATLLERGAVEVRIASWPDDSPTGYDVADHVANGGDAEGLARVINSAVLVERKAKAQAVLGKAAEAVATTSTDGTEASGPTGERSTAKSVTVAVEDTMDTTADEAHREVLAALWVNRYRWAGYNERWMGWTGQRWQPKKTQHLVAQAAVELREYYTRALAVTDDRAETKRLARLRVDICFLARMQRAVSKLEGWKGFLVEEANEWDSDPWLLNIENGTLDLRTGTLRPHDPADMLTKLAPVSLSLDPADTTGAWQAHLDLFLPDRAVQRHVQRDLGVALVGDNERETLSLWWGKGANGKTTTARAVEAVLGDYATHSAPDLLMRRRHEQHPTEVADLLGKRVVFGSEVADGAALDEVKMKRLTGGEKVKARFMRGDFIYIDPTWTFFIPCNDRPSFRGTTVAMLRRLSVVPFLFSLPLDQQRPQPEVIAELVADGPAILRWCLDGLADWRAHPTWFAPAVSAATAEYHAEQDHLATFLRERCEERRGATVPSGELHEAYQSWCAEEADEEALGKTAFGKRMKAQGFTQRREGRAGSRLWAGLRLRSNDPQGDEE